MSDYYKDYPSLIKQLKSMHITQLYNLMIDINDYETVALLNEVTCEWLTRNSDNEVAKKFYQAVAPVIKSGTVITYSTSEHANDAKKYLSEYEDAKQLDDAQRHRDIKTDNRCYE